MADIKRFTKDQLRRIWHKVKKIKGVKEEPQLQFDLIDDAERARQRAYAFQKPVVFSILTPLYNTPQVYLEEMIDSLKAQTYSGWELCLADGSDEEHAYVGEYCAKMAEEDPRIRYKKLEENKGISENTNACIELASGEYFGLLDHDDRLHESALFEMMVALEKTDADFLYTDETHFTDRIDASFGCNFKPAFGKDELRSHNFICHFTVFRKALLDGSERLYRSECDGSQDHDMVLRLTEKAKSIVHIPKVLYYWRVHPQSVSMDLNSKRYAIDAALRAIADQLERTGETGEVGCNLPYETIYRVRYEIKERPLITILLSGRTEDTDLEAAKEMIREKTDYPNLEIEAFPPGDTSWGEKVKEALKEAGGKYCVMMDSECVPDDAGWLDEMLMFAQRKDVGFVTPKVLDTNGCIRYAGAALDRHVDGGIRFLGRGIPDSEQGYEAILRHVRNTTLAFRCCMMIETDKLRAILKKREADEIAGYEEFEWSLGLGREGLWHVWTPFAVMRLGENFDVAVNEEEKKAFFEKYQEILKKEDPFYHPRWRELGLV